MKRQLLILSLLPALILWSGCSRTDQTDPIETYYNEGKEYMDNMFSVYYWWNDQLPSSVSWNKNFYDYFNGYKVSQDKWSWMETGDEWRDSESGVVSGSYGASYSQPLDYGDYNLYVRYVLLGSPMYEAGVRRGWRLDSVGGYEVRNLIKSQEGINTLNAELVRTSNVFVFVDGNGISHEFSLSASAFSTHTYLDYRVFTSSDYPGLSHGVAYFNYRTFVDALTSDITEAFEQFRASAAEDLILDLRYNGGGSVDALNTLVGYIAPKSLDGEIFSVVTHNDNLSILDKSYLYEVNDRTLSLNRLFVITGGGTASASEVLINGLRAGFGDNNVITVGNTTYGKPNGMYAFAYPEGSSSDDYYDEADYVFMPICFYTCNGNGEQIPDNGFSPMKLAPDDLYHDWGPGENLIRQCLGYVASGSFPEDDTKSSGSFHGAYSGKGPKLSSPEDAADYGRLTARPPVTGR